MDNKKTLKEKYQNHFHKWVISSSSHGLPNIFQSTNIITRLMWISVFLSSFSYCAYTIVKSVVEYSKYETTVSIKKIQELPQVFPTVTICNLNPYNETAAYAKLKLAVNSVYDPYCIFLYKKLLKNNTKYDENEFSNSCNRSDISLVMHNLKLSMANLIKKGIFSITDVGYPRDELIIYLNFNGDTYFTFDLYNYDNGKSVFNTFWNYEYGLCYTFNDGKTKKLLKTSDMGINSGIIFYAKIRAPFESADYSDRLGLCIFIHNQSDSVYSLSKGIQLPPGNSIYIGVDRVFNYKEPSPYSDCIDELKSDNPYAQRLFGYFNEFNITSYDQNTCLNFCYQDKLIDACNCSDFKAPALRNTGYCGVIYDYECLVKFQSKYYQSDLKTYCNNACKEKCDTIEFNYELQYSQFPPLGRIPRYFSTFGFYDLEYSYLNLSEDQLKEYGRNSFMEVRINYNNLHYTVIKESPSITFESLLGSIGGQLGLFIGISFLSLIEVIELFIDFIFLYFQHRNQPFSQVFLTVL